MKQAEDNTTLDMFGDAPKAPWIRSYTYEFYVRDHDGNETRWTGLTKTKAKQMHAYTSQSNPCNVVSFGWELRT